MDLEVSSKALRLAANQAELRGDWGLKELLDATADKLIRLEGQNEAYRHSLQAGVSINMVGKRHWFNRVR